MAASPNFTKANTRWPSGTDGSNTSDVIIVGGGLQGLSSAMHLSRRGWRVRLLESEYCGRHASGVNAGGVRTLGRHLAEIPLALAARDRIWHRMAEYIGHDGGFVGSGQLQIAENEAEAVICKERIALLESHGYTHEKWIDQSEVRKLVPSIAPHVIGGIWVKDDGYAYPYHIVMAFRQAALDAGAKIHEHSPVRRISREAGIWHVVSGEEVFQAPKLVNTAGAWAGELARQAGDEAPMKPDGLMLMVTERMAPFVKPVLGATGRALSFKQFANGTVVIGGGLRCSADAAARHAPVDLSTMKSSAVTVTELFPQLRNIQIVRAWSGVEGFLPDDIPVIGPGIANQDIFHAFGFSAHGFELSPIVGEIMADLVEYGHTSLPIQPFRIDRFTQQEKT